MRGKATVVGLAYLFGFGLSPYPLLVLRRGAAPNATNAHRGEIPPNYSHERIGAQAKRKSGKRPKRK